MTLAITGASGKTGWRIADEALQRGQAVRAILRQGSVLPAALQGRHQLEVVRLELGDAAALRQALQGCEALVIATGARPSIDLAGPLKVDALAIRDQLTACPRCSASSAMRQPVLPEAPVIARVMTAHSGCEATCWRLGAVRGGDRR